MMSESVVYFINLTIFAGYIPSYQNLSPSRKFLNACPAI